MDFPISFITTTQTYTDLHEAWLLHRVNHLSSCNMGHLTCSPYHQLPWLPVTHTWEIVMPSLWISFLRHTPEEVEKRYKSRENIISLYLSFIMWYYSVSKHPFNIHRFFQHWFIYLTLRILITLVVPFFSGSQKQVKISGKRLKSF